MPGIDRLPPEERAEIVARLKRIEGQAKGVQRMVEEGRDCLEVLDQIASIRAAAHALSAESLEAIALYCLRHPEEFPSAEAAVGHIVRALARGGR